MGASNIDKATEIEKPERKRRGYGEGSYYQRKDGRWVAKVQDPSLNKPIYRYAQSEAEVKKKLQELKVQVARGTAVKNKTFVSDYMETWLTTFKFGTVEASTYDQIESRFKTHIKEEFRRDQMGTVSSARIQKFFQSKTDTMSYATANYTKQLFDKMFEYALAEGDINKNPMINVVLPRESFYKSTIKKVQILDEDEIKRLEKVIDIKSTYSGNTKYKYTYLLIFLLYTGLRKGELLALRWEDIDFNSNYIRIDKSLSIVRNRKKKNDDDNEYIFVIKKPKTKQSIRNIPFVEKAKVALAGWKAYCEENHAKSEWVVTTANGSQLRPSVLAITVPRILKAAGIDKNIKGVHFLRHSFASRCLRSGIRISVISEWLGHKNISITYNTYIHIIEEEKQDAFEMLEAI